MCKSVYNSSMDIHTENNKMRKSLAVDVKTYDLLQEICDMERRSKIASTGRAVKTYIQKPRDSP